MYISALYVKSCISDYERIISQQRKSMKYMIDLLEELREEEETLMMPAKAQEPNSFGFSSVQTHADSTFNAVVSISKANLEKRAVQINRSIENIQADNEMVERVMLMFHCFAYVYPVHTAMVNDYLFEKKLKIRDMKERYQRTHETINAMIDNLCEAIAQLVSVGIDTIDRETILLNLSREILEELEKNEYKKGRTES